MDSKLIIAKGIKIDKNYTNVLSYDTNDMLALVEENAEYSQDNYNYIDYDKREILADVDYSLAIECNYMAFQNPRHGNKWYFAFIEDCIYKAPKQCKIVFSIDVWSTFFDNWTAKSCFVVREHVNDDTVGKHTVPENVTTGDYVCVYEGGIQELLQNPKVIISATVDEGGARSGGNIYNGIPTAYDYFMYAMNDASGIQNHINVANASGGDINQIFIAPDWIVGGTIGAHLIEPTNVPKRDYGAVPEITQLDGYTPKNKKLLTYPYCFDKLTNMQGQESILHQELWADSTQDGTTGKILEITACLTAGCSVRAFPHYYAGESLAPDYGISGAKYPQLNWKTDSYINWLTQQGVNEVTQTAEDTIINPGSVLNDISNLLVSNYKAYKTPPQVKGNINCGDVMFARGLCTIYILSFTIRREFAKQIDDYFSRFGYKINETKIPNIYGRSNFNFVEIGKDECIGYGDVPSKYMEQINDICRQGVTIWHNHENLGNYAVNNGII